MPRISPFDPQNRVRLLRTKSRKTLSDIATALKTTPAQIARLERGERDLDVGWMRKIAPELNVLAADLLLPEDGALDTGERELIEALRCIPENHRNKLAKSFSEILQALN